jgi:hypothetical protein
VKAVKIPVKRLFFLKTLLGAAALLCLRPRRMGIPHVAMDSSEGNTTSSRMQQGAVRGDRHGPLRSTDKYYSAQDRDFFQDKKNKKYEGILSALHAGVLA